MLLPVMEPEEAVPLSYLSQYGYCPRRAGLLLLDQAWAESADTAEGEAEHARVHTQRIEKRGDFLKLYEYPVFSRRLGLKGLCDCIEARKSESGASLPNLNTGPSATSASTSFSYAGRQSVWRNSSICPFRRAASST